MSEFWIAESGIRQLHARFVDAVWRQDAAGLADCVTENVEWKIAGMHLRGRADVSTTLATLLGGCERIRLIVGDPILDVSGRTALGRVPMTELAKMKDTSFAMTLGVYYDRYVEEAGRWRYQWRHFGLHYRGPGDMSAPFVESPDYGPFPGMPAPDEPTMTRRAPLT